VALIVYFREFVVQKKTRILVIMISVIATLVFAGLWLYDHKQPETVPEMTVTEKKARFCKLLVPPVEKVYAQLLKDYLRIEDLVKKGAGGQAQRELEKLKQDYRAKTDAELLMAMKPHPKSIALAQAALESSWATSRFFRVANNVFGVWSFDEDEARVAAQQKRGNKTIWVKKYSSLEASIRDYYRTLGRGAAFGEFRKLKMVSDDPFELVKKLDRYSEKGAAYGEELAAVIRHNDFTAYD